MGAFDNRDSKKMGIFLIVVFIILIAIISFVVGGVDGLFGILRTFFLMALVVGFFGFLFYIIYFLFFRKHRKDVPYENWKGYLKSAKDNGSDMMDDLILTGDQKHSSKRFMTIKGYLRVQGFNDEPYDMFVGKRSPSNPFEEWKIIMLKPKQHSDLIGDVYVYGISLIMKYGYYFINTDMLDFIAIDQGVANDTFRSIMYGTLGDMKQMMDRAIGLDAEYRKEQMQGKLLKIPTLAGQQGDNNQNQG